MTVAPTVLGWQSLVTPEHSPQPRFMATLAAMLTPLETLVATVNSIPNAFDLDLATGAQLDTLGVLIGISRFVTTPLTGVYFSLDSATLGLDQGSLQGPFDPITGLTSLPDDAYKTLLRATIAANHWDGTIPGAYAVFDLVFQAKGYGLLIQDLGGMSMLFALTGTAPDAVTLALFVGGYLKIKPAGVAIAAFFVPAFANAPYFGLDANSPQIAGLDIGAFGTAYPGI